MARILPRGYTAAVWAAQNPVLLPREYAYETDTLKHKYGDGITAWNSLPYAVGEVDILDYIDAGDNITFEQVDGKTIISAASGGGGNLSAKSSELLQIDKATDLQSVLDAAEAQRLRLYELGIIGGRKPSLVATEPASITTNLFTKYVFRNGNTPDLADKVGTNTLTVGGGDYSNAAFSGDDYLTTPSNTDWNAANASFMRELKVTHSDVTGNQVYVSNTTNGSNNGHAIYYSNNNILFYIYDPSDTKVIFVPMTPTVGQELHILYGYNASTQQMFLRVNNTTATPVTKATGAVASNSATLFGNLTTGGSFFFKGQMSLFRAWRRFLTTDEIGGVFGDVTSPTFSFISTDLDCNLSNGTNANYPLQSAFAEASFKTRATSVTLNGYTNIQADYPGTTSASIYVNGVHNTLVLPPANGAYSQTVTLAAGLKTVTVRAGLQQFPPDGSLLGTFLTSVSFNTAAYQIKPEYTGKIAFLGDSIEMSGISNAPQKDGYIARLRAVRTEEIFADGWGHNSVYQLDINALIANLKARRIEKLICTLGTNDYGFNKWSGDTAAFKAKCVSLVTALRDNLPSLDFTWVTPIMRTISGQDAALEVYRTKITEAVTQVGFGTVLSGKNIVDAANIGDGVHPNAAGDTQLFNYFNALLG